MKKYRYIVGIDCGVNTGFACWDRVEKKLTHVQSMKIHQAIDLLKYWVMDRKITLIRVEDPRKAVFGRNKLKDFHKAQGAGSVKRDAVIWEDFLKDNKFHFEMVRPNKATTKLKADVFKQITGWQEQTNEHSRDAGMLCYGF